MSYLGCSVRLYLQLFVGGRMSYLRYNTTGATLTRYMYDHTTGTTLTRYMYDHTTGTTLTRYMYDHTTGTTLTGGFMSYLGCSVRLYL
jgi:DNA-directed RNA polymerase subunit L